MIYFEGGLVDQSAATLNHLAENLGKAEALIAVIHRILR
jgi:hypothetical protein